MGNGVSGSSANLLQAISASESLDMVVVPTPKDDSDSDESSESEEEDGDALHITIEKKGEQGLGIDFYHVLTGLKITKVKHGAISEWNAANPDAKVVPGHSIVEVNGICGSGDKLLGIIQASQKLFITLEFGALSQGDDSEDSDDDDFTPYP